MKKSFLTSLILFICVLNLQAENTIKVYTTTADGTRLLKYTTSEPQAGYYNVIKLKPSTQYQSIDGFGFAMTYSSAYNLLKMNRSDRLAFLRKTYSREEGLGSSYIRMSIGCSDFSSREYTYCDKQGLENFALQSDELDYIIPVLKEILAINPDVKIIGAPWTCPRWMKVSDLNSSSVYNSWTSGHLNPKYYQDYATYFVKFIQAMQEQGIPIYAVTPQNEPLNKGNCASLYMPWAEEAAFLKYLAPAFKKAGLSTKIYVFDHNFNYDNIDSQVDYPVNVYNALGDSFEGSELVVGSAWHNYGGNSSELEDIHEKAPAKEMIFTEASIGTWNDGQNLQTRLMDDMKNLVLACVNRYCRAVMVWNLMLDTNRGPNLDGGCTTCYGAVDIDPTNYRTITANSHYYVLSHMSAVVQPGAHRIGTESSTISGITYCAFQNPDDTYAFVVCNTATSARRVSIKYEDDNCAVITVPSNGICSVLIDNKEDEQYTLGGSPFTKEESAYSLTREFQQGEAYDQDFITDGDWYTDPDFFLLNDKNQLVFQPVSGTYTVAMNTASHSILVTPQENNLTSEGQGNIYLIGAESSIGKPCYSGGTSTSWSTANALPMAQVGEKVYRISLKVGEQLNASNVNFKFFGSLNWSPEFCGKSGSAFYLTTNSPLFAIGKGYGGHDDGNIYLRSTNTKLSGYTCIFTIDLTAGVNAGVLMVDLDDGTGIKRLSTSPLDTESIYNLQGQRMNSTPQKGIYIKGNRVQMLGN